MTTIPHTLTETSLTILGPDFSARTIPSSHLNFQAVVDAIRAGSDYDVVMPLIDVSGAIAAYMQGSVVICDRTLYFNNRVLDTRLTRRIMTFMDEAGDDAAKPLINFLEKVMSNPSRRAVEGLYDWIEAGQMPVHPDGDILAYKIVKDDYRDYYTGTFDHSVGKVVEVPRNTVDEDPDRTCSHGLHFCSAAYLSQYHAGDDSRRIVLVKINPADVVAFPRDCSISKGRTCRLEVIAELDKETADELLPKRFVYDHFETDELDLSDAQPGDRYETRDGGEVTIDRVAVGYFGRYPVNGRYNGPHDDDGEVLCWTLAGRYLADGDDDPRDIVALIDRAPEPELDAEAVRAERIEQAEALREAVQPKPKGFFSRLFGR